MLKDLQPKYSVKPKSVGVAKTYSKGNSAVCSFLPVILYSVSTFFHVY